MKSFRGILFSSNKLLQNERYSFDMYLSLEFALISALHLLIHIVYLITLPEIHEKLLNVREFITCYNLENGIICSDLPF